MVGTHDGGCQCHQASADQIVDGTHWLNDKIDLDNIVVINEKDPGSCLDLFRPHSLRTADQEVPCSPEEREEGLVMCVPFTCPVKITALTVIGGDNGKSPCKVNLFANLADPTSVMDVNSPTQSVDLVEDFCGTIEYPLRVTRFSQVNYLTLEFPPSGDMQVFWIGLKGIASGDARKAVVTVYESRANLADHQKTAQSDLSSKEIH